MGMKINRKSVTKLLLAFALCFIVGYGFGAGIAKVQRYFEARQTANQNR
jgi:CHASE3 domain sensor protein